MKLNLISFELCPFAQRSVITLLEKGMDYEITYLSQAELKTPPQWFRDISPFGKVPVLRVDDTTLFESSVIMEYIDEISPPSLHPTDPLQKALNRAWMSFGGELLLSQYRYATATDEKISTHNRQEIHDGLQRLEDVLGDGPFFNGPDFHLIDAAFASFFMRLDILEDRHPSGFYDSKPKVAQWAESLRQRDTVKNSVIPDLADKYINYLCHASDYAAQIFGHPAE